jgi:hypothetical protein
MQVFVPSPLSSPGPGVRARQICQQEHSRDLLRRRPLSSSEHTPIVRRGPGTAHAARFCLLIARLEPGCAMLPGARRTEVLAPPPGSAAPFRLGEELGAALSP